MVKATPAEGGTQGVVEEIAKGAVGPVVDALKSAGAALWTRKVERTARIGDDQDPTGGCQMARIWRHPRAGLRSGSGAERRHGLVRPSGARRRSRMHTAKIWTQAVDAEGRFAVTGSDDRTVRVWSVADGRLLRTIWIPAGPGESASSTRWRSVRTGQRSPPAAGQSDSAVATSRSTYSTASPETSFIEFTAIYLVSPTFSRSRPMATTSLQRYLAGMVCGSSTGKTIGARPSATTNTETTVTAQRSRGWPSRDDGLG